MAKRVRLFRRVYSPFSHLVSATRNIGKSLFSRSSKILDNGLGAVDNVGHAVAKHANAAVRNVTRRRGGSRRSASRRAATRRANRR